MSGSDVAAIRRYWNEHVHDLAITDQPIGSPAFFRDLDAYHFEKLHHLLRLVDFDGWSDRVVLDVGCGAGVELVRFLRGRANAVGIELSDRSADLARAYLAQTGYGGRVVIADAETLPIADGSVDLVYAHGVVQYTADDRRLVAECRRVLRPGGLAVFQMYNRRSWLQLLSRVMRVPLEHEDAPMLRRYTIGEVRELVRDFEAVEIVTERFPVRSRLHQGWKGLVYNTCFVGTFNALPRAWVRRFGWHLLAFCRKAAA